MNKLGFIKSFLLNFIKLNNPKVAVLKGSDMLGNKYYEIPMASYDVDGDNRPKRYVDGENSMTNTNVTIPNIPHQWEAWLRFRRDEAPTQDELQPQMNKKESDRVPVDDSSVYVNINRSLEDQILPDIAFNNPIIACISKGETLTTDRKHVDQDQMQEPEPKMEKQDQYFKKPPKSRVKNEIPIQAKREDPSLAEETKPKMEKKQSDSKKPPPKTFTKIEFPIQAKREDPVRVEETKTKIEKTNANVKKPVITYVSNEFPIRAKREDPVQVEEAKSKINQTDKVKEQSTNDINTKKTKYSYVSNEFPIRAKREVAQEMKIKQK